MFRMDLYKKSIINLYKSINYISIHGDIKNIDKYKQETCRYLKNYLSILSIFVLGSTFGT